MELGREFQGATVAESNPEDHPVQLVRLLFLEAANQLRLELGRKFQGATIAESEPEDNSVHLIRIVFIETEDQLGLELGRKFQGAKLSNPSPGGCSSHQVAEREDLAKGEGDEGGIRLREDSKEFPEEEGELLHQLWGGDQELSAQWQPV